MGSLKEQFEVDMKRFFEQIERQGTNDRKETLRNLFDKYIHLSNSDILLDRHDLGVIISNAKDRFSSKTFPVYLGEKKKKVDADDQANLCVIESTIGFLNKNDCLKKLPKFNYKENKF